MVCKCQQNPSRKLWPCYRLLLSTFRSVLWISNNENLMLFGRQQQKESAADHLYEPGMNVSYLSVIQWSNLVRGRLSSGKPQYAENSIAGNIGATVLQGTTFFCSSLIYAPWRYRTLNYIFIPKWKGRHFSIHYLLCPNTSQECGYSKLTETSTTAGSSDEMRQRNFSSNDRV